MRSGEATTSSLDRHEPQFLDMQRGHIRAEIRNSLLEQEEILPLLAAANEYGPNTVFWVVPADQKHTPGTVHWVMPGLLKGYINRFAPNDNAHDLSLEVWMELCVNAYQLAHSHIEAALYRS